MKIKEGFILKTIANNTVAIPVGGNLVDLQLMLTLNESGTFLWKALQSEKTLSELVALLMQEYDVDEKTAHEDVCAFVELLKEKQILDEA